VNENETRRKQAVTDSSSSSRYVTKPLHFFLQKFDLEILQTTLVPFIVSIRCRRRRRRRRRLIVC
jgi:hypothetical protein